MRVEEIFEKYLSGDPAARAEVAGFLRTPAGAKAASSAEFLRLAVANANALGVSRPTDEEIDEICQHACTPRSGDEEGH